MVAELLTLVAVASTPAEDPNRAPTGFEIAIPADCHPLPVLIRPQALEMPKWAPWPSDLSEPSPLSQGGLYLQADLKCEILVRLAVAEAYPQIADQIMYSALGAQQLYYEEQLETRWSRTKSLLGLSVVGILSLALGMWSGHILLRGDN